MNAPQSGLRQVAACQLHPGDTIELFDGPHVVRTVCCGAVPGLCFCTVTGTTYPLGFGTSQPVRLLGSQRGHAA